MICFIPVKTIFYEVSKLKMERGVILEAGISAAIPRQVNAVFPRLSRKGRRLRGPRSVALPLTANPLRGLPSAEFKRTAKIP